jgi:DNA replication protein DnaC
MTKKPTTVKREPNPVLYEQVEKHFEHLRLAVKREQLEAALTRGEREGLGYLEFLDALLGTEANRRRERGIERRIKAARFAEHKTLEEFDWEFNKPVIKRSQFEELATGEFIKRHDNFLFVGQSGIGKSHLIQALGIRACSLGYSVLYTTSAAMISDLTSALVDKSLPEKLRAYTKPNLLIIDEFGFDRVERLESPEAGNLLFKVVHARSTKGSIALATNVDCEQWGAYFNDPPISTALLDRLVAQATIIKISKAKSFRAEQTKRGRPAVPPKAP